MNQLVILSCLIAVCAAAPGVLFHVPAASSSTKVVRDFLGNQATAYSYQDGHSSAVAVSRNDVSKHLVAAPVVQYAADPLVYSAPYQPYQYQHAYAAPAYTYGHYSSYGHYPAAYSSPAYYF